MAKINGNQNGNVLKGTSGRDTIKGLGGNDSLFGYAGNDILEGGADADHLDGGDGIDRAEYRKSKAGATVNLGLNFGLGGEAQGDTFTSIENVYGSRYADLLVGDGANNLLVGRNGDDTLKGEDGADRLLGGNGKDTLEGGDDNDRLDGGRGADHLDGGSGSGDRAEYARSKSGVTVDLEAGTGQGGDAQGDTLVNVENVLGSKHDDVLTGDGEANKLYGNNGDDELNGAGGDDTLDGGKGADEMDGGEGSDTASYSRSKQAVQVDLAAGTAQGGDAAGDTLTNIENLTGSRKSDTLSGDENDNTLSGGRGNDTLEGRDGNDDLNGRRGRDTLDGGEGDDNLNGGDSSDTYVYAKGDGADTIQDGGHKDKDVIEISGYEADQTFVVRLEGSDDLLISFGGENGGDSIIVKNTLGGSTADTVEQIKFEDGTIWKIADVITRVDNEAPVAVDDLGSTVLPDQKVVIPVANMLSNDSDPDGDELSLVSVYDAKGGTVEITEDGEVVFTPEAGFSGTASFLYTVTDGTAASEAMCAFDVEVQFSQFIGNWWAETIDLSGSALPCYIDCGLGNDIATGSDLRDQILGAGGDDTMNGGGGNDDFLIGLGHGFDRFDGGDGYDVVLATEDGVSIGLIGDFNASVEEFSCAGFANVGIMGTWQAQTLDFTGVTLTDIQWIDAGRGNDTVLGSAGDDVIIGGLGDDNLSGGDGDDDFLVGPGDGFDTIDGGSGFDQILATADGTNIGFLGSFANGVEEISANGFADVQITANWQSQTYDFSNVTLTGITAIDMGSGNDTAIGSAGDDVIIGGFGNDALTGNLGADTFVFADGDGQDVITDFNLADDVARLDEIAGFEDFADVQGALSQVGADTLLDFGDGQTILFEDTLAGAFSSDNFDFLLGDL
ncbi:MAG: hypothetical protein GY948_14870 [Alphaproteobacteria bacterium]|nr:hypothetical protein [Alphaproteobacteria bacterium]